MTKHIYKDNSAVSGGGGDDAAALELVPERDVELGEKIGEGAFGAVYLAKYYEAQMVSGVLQCECRDGGCIYVYVYVYVTLLVVTQCCARVRMCVTLMRLHMHVSLCARVAASAPEHRDSKERNDRVSRCSCYIVRRACP